MFDLKYLCRDYQLSNTAVLAYGILLDLSKASKAKGKDYVWISRRAIGERLNRTERTARRVIKELERADLIRIKRMGRGLNDHITIFYPQTQQEEKDIKFETTNHSIYMSAQKRLKMSALNNTIRENKNIIDISINPQNDNAPTAQTTNKGYTAPKGKPTNKRPQNNVIERKKLKKRIKDYLKEKVSYEDVRRDIFLPYEEAEAFDKMIELIANTAAAKGKVMVNGTLLTASEWWKEVMNISQNSIRNIIYKIEHFENVRNPRAYILAMLYNASLEEKISAPAFTL